MSVRVGFMGGGITGCMATALLAQHESLEVVLADSGRRLGSGSTAKNHGRGHAGSTGAKSDPVEVTNRKLLGSRYLRALPNIADSSGPGVYVCDKDVIFEDFKSACLMRGMDVSPMNKRQLPNEWLNSVGAQGMSVPEFSWSPVQVALNFARVGHSRGATILLNCKAKEVRRTTAQKTLSVECRNGDDLKFDVVVNLASKYANEIRFEDWPALLTLEHFRWPVMALPSNVVPRLDTVLVVVDGKGLFPSVIPHRDWITFDCKTTPERVEGPDAYPTPNPSHYNQDKEQERLIFDETRRVFKPLSKLSHADFGRNAKVFYGIHARRLGELYTSDISKTFSYEGIDSYFVRHGGLATTALLDAIETVEEVELRLGIKSISREARISKIAVDLAKVWPDRGMIYEDRGSLM